LESYEFNVVDYLLKPFSFQRFLKAIGKVNTIQSIGPKRGDKEGDESFQEHKKDPHIFFKSGYEYIRLIPEEVLFIKSDLEYTEIHMGEKKYISSEPLAHWEEELKNKGFVRVHKSYLINTSQITKISRSKLYLRSGVT
jgi:DNA-binding LytR/AlgR family response regulator